MSAGKAGKCCEEMGREPTPEEHLGDRMEMPEDKVRRVLKIAKEPHANGSMETPIGDDEDSHQLVRGDFIEMG